MAAVCWDAGSWNISKYNDYPLEKIIYRKSVTGMSEIEKRTRRCCFTGHRPEKLTVENTKLCRELGGAIDKAISDGFYTFISGMSRDVDLWAAAIVLSRKQLHPEIHLICAIPHPGFEENWNSEWQLLYHNVLAEADLIRTISPTYFRGCYQIRNCWMVNHSSLVIAVYNGSKGGTQNTIRYAEQQGVSIRIIRA